METSHLLKQETSLTLESLHDFAKWKLIVTSSLAAAGLGLTPVQGKEWLLLLIPYASAYIDLNCYQYLIRIIVLSRFLKGRNEDPLLRAYEDLCQTLHAKYGVFNLGQYAQIGVSLVTGLAPFVTCVEFFRDHKWGSLTVAIGLWVAGIYLIVALWRYYNRKLELASKGPIDDLAQQATAAS